MTTPEVIELVRRTRRRSRGEITLDVKEGDLLPETYFYSRDDTRDGLLMRMKEAMDKTLDEAWRKRAAGLPLANRREALTLASIVEKETAVPAERAKVAAVYINRLRRRMKLESDPDDDLRPDPGQGAVQPRADARRSAVEHALQHLRRHRPAARADLQSGPRLDPGRDQPGARPRALVRGRRAGRTRLRHHARRAQSQRRALAPDPARARRAADSRRRRRARPARRPCRLPASSVRRRDREPCRPSSWPWSSSPSSPSASPGSCAPTRPRWRAALRMVLVVLGAIAVGGMLIFGLRFLPSLLPELFGLAGLVITGLIARALRNRPSGGFSSPGTGRRTEVRTAFLQAWIDHGTGDVGGTVLAGRFAGRTLDRLSDSELLDLHEECRGRRRFAARDGGLSRPAAERRLAHRATAAARIRAEGAAQRHDARGGAGRAGAGRRRQRGGDQGRAPPPDPAHAPDAGGTADLAARINRAKDVLVGGLDKWLNLRGTSLGVATTGAPLPVERGR